METIDNTEYNDLFPEDKEFLEWVRYQEVNQFMDNLNRTGKSNSLYNDTEVFNPFNTVNS